MSLCVLAPGTCSLLVDAGRPAARGLGVPIGGPADGWALAVGNALVGNPPDAPALEVTLTGPTLVAEADVGLGLFGAPFRMRRDGAPVEPGATFTLCRGQTLHIGGTPRGCRAYLCVAGGFQAPVVLGSRTGLEPLTAGDRLDCAPSALPGRGLGEVPPPDDVGAGVLRALAGPQADWFDNRFYDHEYRVTPASNRMGVRLDGPALARPDRVLVSEPVAPGAVQITNDGWPVVLGVDGQTIGGYPKVAHVISADLDRVGQLRPGDVVRFVRVPGDVAERLARERAERLRKWVRRIGLAVG